MQREKIISSNLGIPPSFVGEALPQLDDGKFAVGALIFYRIR